MEDELSNYLAALSPDEPWRVDAVLKSGALETTQRVYFVGRDGFELGPFVRKRLSAGLGSAYQTIFVAQNRGARLVHIPRIIWCDQSGDELVVVMEFVRGETLGGLVAAVGTADGRLSLVRRVFPGACDAVSELSERFDPPLVHRDLKPSNVMVSGNDVTLIDFGVARTYHEGAEQDTTRFGTRAYAPPEQFGFGQTSVRSDVYALGMLLFFCAAGHEPTTCDRERGFVGEGLPEGLREVIVRATQLDPQERFASARELRTALLAAMPADGEGQDAPERPLAAAPASAVEHLGTVSVERGAGPDSARPRAAAVSAEKNPGASARLTAPSSPEFSTISATPAVPPVPAAPSAPAAPPVPAASATPPVTPAPSSSSFISEEPPAFERPNPVAVLLARIPRVVGVAWNVACLLFLLVLLIGCVGAMIYPSPENARWPTWYLVYSYVGFMMPVFVILTAMVLDRRPLRRIFPQLMRFTLGQELRAELVAFLVVFGVWLAVTLIGQP